MHESRSVVSDSLWPHGLYNPWNSPGQNTGVGSLSLFQGIFPIQGLNQVSCIAGHALPSEPPGKPKNTGVGSLSLLQGIFLTQESNRSLLHCRQILCQRIYQGSFFLTKTKEFFFFLKKSDIWKCFSKFKVRIQCLTSMNVPKNVLVLKIKKF